MVISFTLDNIYIRQYLHYTFFFFLRLSVFPLNVEMFLQCPASTAKIDLWRRAWQVKGGEDTF